MADEDYSFIPSKELDSLESEITKLKDNPILSPKTSKELSGSIDQLQQTLNDLLSLFRRAAADPSIVVPDEAAYYKKVDQLVAAQDETNKKLATIVGALGQIQQQLSMQQAASFSGVSDPDAFISGQLTPEQLRYQQSQEQQFGQGQLPPQMPAQPANTAPTAQKPAPKNFGSFFDKK